jgi:hypothetical protein
MKIIICRVAFGLALLAPTISFGTPPAAKDSAPTTLQGGFLNAQAAIAAEQIEFQSKGSVAAYLTARGFTKRWNCAEEYIRLLGKDCGPDRPKACVMIKVVEIPGSRIEPHRISMTVEDPSFSGHETITTASWFDFLTKTRRMNVITQILSKYTPTPAANLVQASYKDFPGVCEG